MPEKFRQYNLSEILSKKYSHTTYLASPTDEPERQVVLIVLDSSLFLPGESENWLLDAQRIKRLHHPYLAPILDMGIEEGQQFIVREYLPNGSVRSRLREISSHQLELKEALTIVLEVGLALTYAHENKIIHGSIKPENILFNANGHAILTDFTLVDKRDIRIRDQTAEEYAFCYMAPEQFSGTCDARSDQYALGCLAYELITGQVPFASQGIDTMTGHHNNARPAPLSESGVDLSPSLEAAVLKSLAKDPAKRFADCSLLLEIIQSTLSPTAPIFPITRSAHSRKNRTTLHPSWAAEIERYSSSSHKHVASNLSEQFTASSDVKVETTESVGTLSASDVSRSEWAGIIPPLEPLAPHLHSSQFTFSLLEETDLVDNRASENEIPNLSLDDLFAKTEADILPATTPLSLDHKYNASATTKTDLALVSSINLYKSHLAQLLSSKRRVLERALLLSVIVVLTAYVLWPLLMSTSKTNLQVTDKKQLVIARISSTSAASVPAQNIPTQKASATTISVVHSSTPTANSTPTTNSASTTNNKDYFSWGRMGFGGQAGWGWP